MIGEEESAVFMSRYSGALGELIHKAKRSSHYEQGDEIEGVEGYKSAYRDLLDELEEAVEYVAFLLVHQCEYGENDYCFHCGRDGRA